MEKDEQIVELSALLEQERAYVAKLRFQLLEQEALQRHMISGLDVWKDGFEKLYHEHHVLAGSNRSSNCNLCLREGNFALSDLVPVASPEKN